MFASGSLVKPTQIVFLELIAIVVLAVPLSLQLAVQMVNVATEVMVEVGLESANLKEQFMQVHICVTLRNGILIKQIQKQKLKTFLI
jgi:hypothetical protein